MTKENIEKLIEVAKECNRSDGLLAIAIVGEDGILTIVAKSDYQIERFGTDWPARRIQWVQSM